MRLSDNPEVRERELVVLRMLSEGYGAKGIASSVSLSVRTVDAYIDHLKQRNGARNIAHLVAMAVTEKVFHPQARIESAAEMRELAERFQRNQIHEILEQLHDAADNGKLEMVFKDLVLLEVSKRYLIDAGYKIATSFDRNERQLKITW